MNLLSTTGRWRQAAICFIGMGILLTTANASRAQEGTVIAVAQPPGAPAAAPAAPCIDPSGCWCGKWYDTCASHCGPLKAEICKYGCCDGQYKVRFHGRFWKFFPFTYTIYMHAVEQKGDVLILSGQENLGCLFGTFTYTAQVTCSHFSCTFCSCRYQGRFELDRTCCKGHHH